jgi:LysR family transcriptional regulator, glycine cleavage system transcriptional activator
MPFCYGRTDMTTRRRLPPLNALVAFDAVARNGSFTRAAQELTVAQPAVTRHVANLESWLGVALFHRHGNAISLTKDGHQAADLAVSVLDRLEVGLGAIRAAPRSEVVIGSSFGMAHLWVIPRISGLRMAAGGAAINFVTSENYDAFDRQGVDLSIRFGTGQWAGVQSDLLFQEETHVIASPEFLAAHPTLDPQNLPQSLRGEWLLDHGDQYNVGWMTWRSWFRHHGVPLPPIPTPEVRNFPTLLDMVRSGEGVAIGVAGLDDAWVQSCEIIRLGPAIKRPGLGYYLTHRANCPPAALEVRNFLLGRGS